MTKTYILIDLANTFQRARYAIQGDIDIKLGSAFNITLGSIRKAWKDFNGSHVVVALEGRSWRKDYYQPYKRNRSEARAALTESELEEEQLFWESFDKFKNFLIEQTNCTVLHHPSLEADDLIAGWAQVHKNDNHVIISSDSDFVQLISPRIRQYNGISETVIAHNGYFDNKGNPIKDTKTGENKLAPDPQWLLFEKCIRGDSTDNVFSAYPKVRKTKLLEAFKDCESKGFAWNNLMLQRWVDHNGQEHRVIDDYERNKRLIDLAYQPEDIKEVIKETIELNAKPKQVGQVGVKLLKFCHVYDLPRISERVQSFSEPLNASYS